MSIIEAKKFYFNCSLEFSVLRFQIVNTFLFPLFASPPPPSPFPLQLIEIRPPPVPRALAERMNNDIGINQH